MAQTPSSQTPSHPNPEIDSLLRYEALTTARDHDDQKAEVFRKVVGNLDFSSRPARETSALRSDPTSRESDAARARRGDKPTRHIGS